MNSNLLLWLFFSHYCHFGVTMTEMRHAYMYAPVLITPFGAFIGKWTCVVHDL